jgi:hypothetical protein
VDDGRITGAGTPTLSIASVESAMPGYYGAIAANSCGTQVTSQALLEVHTVPGSTVNHQPAG